MRGYSDDPLQIALKVMTRLCERRYIWLSSRIVMLVLSFWGIDGKRFFCKATPA